MQTFIDTETQQLYEYDDDVQVKIVAGAYELTAAHGERLNHPEKLQPFIRPRALPPTARQLAAQAALAEIYRLETSITQRRLREAVLGTDGGWLGEIEQKIEALRKVAIVG